MSLSVECPGESLGRNQILHISHVDVLGQCNALILLIVRSASLQPIDQILRRRDAFRSVGTGIYRLHDGYRVGKGRCLDDHRSATIGFSLVRVSRNDDGVRCPVSRELLGAQRHPIIRRHRSIIGGVYSEIQFAATRQKSQLVSVDVKSLCSCVSLTLLPWRHLLGARPKGKQKRRKAYLYYIEYFHDLSVFYSLSQPGFCTRAPDVSVICFLGIGLR